MSATSSSPSASASASTATTPQQPTSSSASSASFTPPRLLYALYLSVILETMSTTILTPSLVDIKLNFFHNNIAQSSAISGIFDSSAAVVNLFLYPLLGGWSDRNGRRRFMLVVCGLNLLPPTALLLYNTDAIPTLWIYFGMRVCGGSYYLLIALVLAFVTDIMPGGGGVKDGGDGAGRAETEYHATAFSRIVAMVGVGSFFGPLLASVTTVRVSIIVSLAIIISNMVFIMAVLPGGAPQAVRTMFRMRRRMAVQRDVNGAGVARTDTDMTAFVAPPPSSTASVNAGGAAASSSSSPSEPLLGAASAARAEHTNYHGDGSAAADTTEPDDTTAAGHGHGRPRSSLNPFSYLRYAFSLHPLFTRICFIFFLWKLAVNGSSEVSLLYLRTQLSFDRTQNSYFLMASGGFDLVVLMGLFPVLHRWLALTKSKKKEKEDAAATGLSPTAVNTVAVTVAPAVTASAPAVTGGGGGAGMIDGSRERLLLLWGLSCQFVHSLAYIIFVRFIWEVYVNLLPSGLSKLADPATSSLISKLMNKDQQGLAQSALYGVAALTEGIGPLTFSLLFAAFTDNSSRYDFPAAPFVLASVFLAVALGTAFLLKVSGNINPTSPPTPTSNSPQSADAAAGSRQ